MSKALKLNLFLYVRDMHCDDMMIMDSTFVISIFVNRVGFANVIPSPDPSMRERYIYMTTKLMVTSPLYFVYIELPMPSLTELIFT